MSWQDWAMAIINLWFIYALIPTIRHPTAKPTTSTSLQTAFGCFGMAATLWTMDQRFGPLVIAALGCQWAFIAWQRWMLDGAVGNRKERSSLS